MAVSEEVKKVVSDFISEPRLKNKTEGMGKGLLLAAGLADESNQLTNNIQGQVDQMVVNGDSSVEAAQARVDSAGISYTTLKKRLDDKDKKTDQQIAQTNYEKAGRDYVDAAISAIGNGYIKTTFTTLAALKAAYPNGTDIGPVLVYEDYNRYIYDVNKHEWVSIGPYDPVMVEDGSVTPIKTDFLKPGKNSFNKNDTLLNQFLNYDNGTTRPLDGYSTTRYYIKVRSGQPLTLKNVRVYVLYDNNKLALFGENTGANNVIKTITPTADGYLRVTVSNSVIDTTQVELGTLSTTYEPYYLLLEGLTFNAAQLKTIEDTAKSIMPSENKALKIIKSGDYFFVSSKLDEVNTISISLNKKGSKNGAFSFANTSINDQQVHYTGDDITPIRTSISTVGANHGYTNILEITMIDHGKTMNDLGSIWSDGITEFTLLKISGNILTLGCPYNVDNEGITQSLKVDPESTLEHVSGATNTGLITISNLASTPQLYPSINNIKVKFLLDGQELVRDGIYSGDMLQVIEGYSVMDYKSIIDYAQQNIGETFANETIESLIDLSNTFTFTKGLDCTTTHSLYASKKTLLGRCGFIQSGPLSLENHLLKRYMPNVKVKSDIDFGDGVDMTNYSTSLTYQTSDYIDPTMPPNHYVDWLLDATNNRKYGFVMGYIVDKTNSRNADRLANAPISWDMRSTKKSYPVAFEGTIEEGTYLAFKGFRNYLSAFNVGKATLLTSIKDAKDSYVYADFNQKLVTKKEMEDDLGKETSIVQSQNVSILNEIVDGNGIVLSATENLASGIVKAL